MYEVGTAVEVRALHVMPGAEGREGQLHDHDYRVEAVVRRAELDGRGMVCDLDRLQAALQRTAGHVEGADLEIIRPREAEAVTVEIFARWAHGFMADAIARAGGELLTVKVWESPVAFASYTAPLTP